MWIKPRRLLTYFAATALVELFAATPAGAQTPASAQNVGAGVEEALDAQGSVRVLVALEAPLEATPSLVAKRASLRAMQSDVLRRMAPHEFELAHRYQSVPAVAGWVTREGLVRLLADPNVVRVDLDAPGSGELAQSVPLIGADVLQQLDGLTGAGVTVAVLDSGIDRHHPDLMDALVGEACFCSGGGGCCPDGAATQLGPGAALDDHFHGTHVSSILSGDGNVASVGVAPASEIVSVKVLDRNNRFCCSSDVVAGLDWIITNRPDVRIVNMSLGTFATFAGDCDAETAFTMAFADAIDTLTENGVAVFAASGNTSDADLMKAPGCVANAISVGAVDKGRNVAAFSGGGLSLDLLAPGVNIAAARRGGGVRVLSGTSMATPHAAAAAALLLEAQPRLGPASLLAALVDTGDLLTDPRNGLSHPLINAEAAFLSLEVCDDGIDNDGDDLVDDSDCPPVAIDIQPRSHSNFVRLFGWRIVPVALFGFDDLDGADVDTASLAFGPEGAETWHDLLDPELRARHLRDVDGDGITDLITHYRVRETGIAPMDSEACLRGTIGGEAFRACDAVIPLCRSRHLSRARGRTLDLPPFSLCRRAGGD